MERKLEIVFRVPKFIIVNGIGTVVDTAVLWLFSRYVFNTYFGDYIVAPFISFECAVFTNFCFSFFFIWKDRVQNHSFKSFFRKYLFYNLSATMIFLLKMGILLLVELVTGWDVVICNLIALCFSGIINFSMGEWVIFRKKS